MRGKRDLILFPITVAVKIGVGVLLAIVAHQIIIKKISATSESHLALVVVFV